MRKCIPHQMIPFITCSYKWWFAWGGEGLTQGLGMKLFAFGRAYWPGGGWCIQKLMHSAGHMLLNVCLHVLNLSAILSKYHQRLLQAQDPPYAGRLHKGPFLGG